MKVAVLYSGGKDSTFAIHHCIKKGWEIKYLISVKPTRRDCYLFHFATVEHTTELAKILGIKHIITTCSVANPEKEAEIIKGIVLNDPVGAVVLGGIGLQKTQLISIQRALLPHGIEVFASHAELDHDELIKEMISQGYDIRITQIASAGLNANWLGRKLDYSSFEELKKLSLRYGFHIGGEGGYYDTLVVDGPIFNKKLVIEDAEKVIENEYCGYLKINKLAVVDKSRILNK